MAQAVRDFCKKLARQIPEYVPHSTTTLKKHPVQTTKIQATQVLKKKSLPLSIPTSPVTGQKLVAIDCEMVEVKFQKQYSSSKTLQNSTFREKLKNARQLVGRCSIVNYHGDPILDMYINPRQALGHSFVITDYRTPYSGISKQHLKGAVPFDKARKEILQLLHGCIVIGHSICYDFNALVISRRDAKFSVRDTATNESLRRLAKLRAKSKQTPPLKHLTKLLLERDIQSDKRGHCSLEDARAAIDLYKLVEGNK